MAETDLSSLPHVFSRDAIRQERSHQHEVDNLKSKFSQKDEVIAELLTEHIALKKRLGGEKLKVQLKFFIFSHNFFMNYTL